MIRYQKGNVVLYHADCQSVLPSLDAHRLVLMTDPPYGIALENHDKTGKFRRKSTYAINGDNDNKVTLSILQWAEKQKIPTIVFASPWNIWPGKWRNMIVWDKTGVVGGGGDTARCLKRTWELILTARNGPLNGSRDESVWRIAPHTSEWQGTHIATKPISLMMKLIDKFTKETDTVFDPFTGSGTTGVACIKTGRAFIGCEKEKQFYDLAKSRIRNANYQSSLIGVD